MASKPVNKSSDNQKSVTAEILEKQRQRSREKWVFVSLAANLYFFLSNFFNTGFLGKYLSALFFGLFGTVTFVLPIYFFWSSASFLSNTKDAERKIATKRVVSIAIFLVAFAFIMQMLHGAKGVKITSLYMDGAKDKKGGGLILGGLLVLLHKITGAVGCIILILLLLIIGFIVVMDRSMIETVKKLFKPKYADDFEEQDLSDEDLSAMKEQRAKRRAKNKGVSFTHLNVLEDKKKPKKNRPVPEEEIHELSPVRSNDVLPSGGGDFWETQDVPAPSDEDSDMFPNEEERAEDVTVLKPERRKRRTKADAEALEKETEAVEQTIRDAGHTTATAVSETSFAKPSVSVISGARFTAPTPASETPAKKQNSSAASGSTNGKAEGPSKKKDRASYKFPPLSLLKAAKGGRNGSGDASVKETAMKLKTTLENFGVNVTVTGYSQGPSVTRYEIQPEQGVKVSKITGLSDDLKLALAAADIRIEAPIPGKSAIGIEVPNKESQPVTFRSLLESEAYKNIRSKIAFAVGKDIGGQVIVADIAKMPHLLIAGATGSGKSVCINTLIMSILYKAHPDDVKLIMIDPKQVELAVYNGIPHMLIPVVTDPKKAAGALNWAVAEMTRRYQLFSQYNVRNLEGYNAKVLSVTGSEEGNEELKKMPQIVLIVDELADLMMVAHGEVEDAIVRISQLARAAGIHLVIATQRPSVDVITGLIKANVPSRIAMSVSSGVDSRTILDMVGAEKLLGKGDMLFYPTGYPKPVRVQGAFLSDDEIAGVCDFLKEKNGETDYDDTITTEIESGAASGPSAAGGSGNDLDEYFAEAGKFIISKEKASIGMLQRVYKIGFNRAARIMDQLADAGVVGPEEGTKPRKVLMTEEEFENYIENNL